MYGQGCVQPCITLYNGQLDPETQYMLRRVLKLNSNKFNEQCRTGGTDIRNPKLGVKLNVNSIFGSFYFFEGSKKDF